MSQRPCCQWRSGILCFDMATKEDILEQIVEEYLIMQGYFVQHNIKYRPDVAHPDYISKLDSVHSDIDILAYNPNCDGPERVLAVNCKSWQGGFQPLNEIAEFEAPKKNRARWKSYRELNKDKWSEAFINKIYVLTASRAFTHVTAVTRIKPKRGYTEAQQIHFWESYLGFETALKDNPIRVLTLRSMIAKFNENIDQTPASSEVGRLIQVLRAAGLWDANARTS